MSDQSANSDRATVALVNAKLDEIRAIVEGNARVTEAHFETVRTRLDAMAGLPGRVDTLEQKYTMLASSVSSMERARTYRSTILPPVLIGVATLAVSIIALIVAGGA